MPARDKNKEAKLAEKGDFSRFMMPKIILHHVTHQLTPQIYFHIPWLVHIAIILYTQFHFPFNIVNIICQ